MGNPYQAALCHAFLFAGSLAAPVASWCALSYLYGGGFLNPAWGERKLAMLNRRRREQVPASELAVGLQCGGSDAFSAALPAGWRRRWRFFSISSATRRGC